MTVLNHRRDESGLPVLSRRIGLKQEETSKLTATDLEAYRWLIDILTEKVISRALLCSPSLRVRTIGKRISKKPGKFLDTIHLLSPYEILKAYKCYVQTTSRLEAMKGYIQMSKDHSDAALAFQTICPDCKGMRSIESNEGPQKCPRCNGKGEVKETPESERAIIAARFAGLPIDPPKGPAINQNFLGTSSTSSLETMIDKIEGTTPAAVDVEFEEVDEGDEGLDE